VSKSHGRQIAKEMAVRIARVSLSGAEVGNVAVDTNQLAR
jgi:hypothetical protein